MKFESLPVNAPLRITSGYGERTIDGKKEFHKGVDLGRNKEVNEVAAILAVKDGTVIRNVWNNARGWLVVVEHADGYTTLYQHLREASPKNPGTKVRAGEVIGVMGSTGYSTGVHLHFELAKGNETIDPTPFLKALVPHDWAKEYWDSAKRKGIIDGTRPRDYATREEVITILGRLGAL